MYDYHHPETPHHLFTEKYPNKRERLNLLNTYVGYVPRFMRSQSRSQLEAEADEQADGSNGSVVASSNGSNIPSQSRQQQQRPQARRSSSIINIKSTSELPKQVVKLYNETIYWRPTNSIFWALWGFITVGSLKPKNHHHHHHQSQSNSQDTQANADIDGGQGQSDTQTQNLSHIAADADGIASSAEAAGVVGAGNEGAAVLPVPGVIEELGLNGETYRITTTHENNVNNVNNNKASSQPNSAIDDDGVVVDGDVDGNDGVVDVDEDGVIVEDEEDDEFDAFNYLQYSQERVGLILGDLIQLGLIDSKEVVGKNSGDENENEGVESKIKFLDCELLQE
ncbi:unnamed protein product [Ambrosiozyma monospora]|uniref:Unnamed protein product n=1 Tax=Ambrosiozyma monospora TaxID=43982 RepID=A0A9W6YUI3_AMBMO|nr:unnamed protein product [Ambrosiozyma monospora]